MMTLEGVPAVSQQQLIERKRQTLDFNSAKEAWGCQLGNIPQANIGNIYLPAGCSLNPSQMQQFYTIISALEGINVQPKYFQDWPQRIGMLYTQSYNQQTKLDWEAK